MIVVHEILDFFARFHCDHLVDYGSHVRIQLIKFDFLHAAAIKVIDASLVEFNQGIFIFVYRQSLDACWYWKKISMYNFFVLFMLAAEPAVQIMF